MIQATVHKLDNGKDVVAGTITLKNGKYILSDEDSLLLKNIIKEPVYNKKIYYPKDGENFLKSLPHQYTSPYLRVSLKEVKESDLPKTIREEVVGDLLKNLAPKTDNNVTHEKYIITNG